MPRQDWQESCLDLHSASIFGDSEKLFAPRSTSRQVLKTGAQIGRTDPHFRRTLSQPGI